LIISQQCSLERLEQLEEETEKEERIAQQLPKTAIQFSTKERRESRSRLVKMFSGLSVNTSTDVVYQPTRAGRASVWLGAVVFDDEATPHPGMLVKRRLSSMDTAEAPNRLLRAWTDQGSAKLSDKADSGNENSHADLWRNSESLFEVPADIPRTEAGETSHTSVSSAARTADQIDVSPLSRRTNSIVSGQQTLPTSVSTALLCGSDAMDFIGHDESCEKVAAAILKSFDTGLSSREYCLRVGYGGTERTFNDPQAPIKEFFQLEALGLNPRLLLCREVR
jgi:hypothetical protein